MRLLFIGNSHTYFNDLPALVARQLKAKGVDAQVCLLCKGGMGLDWHAEEPQTRFNILYGNYDWVILQHRAHPMGGLALMRLGAKVISAWCEQAGAKVLLYQTWTRQGDAAAQPQMSEAYRELAESLGARLAPVGDRWQEALLNQPTQSLYNADGSHASLDGSLLAAQVIADTLLAP